ncbi:hyaluronan synthase 1-like [Lethenteron reissneri]|uniref:hyaluronan synthase 1-like n=1 Tax=Lethenteron reissneri TaxID=7753 RepID=UPI002AB5E772|nr:hyaluronan synthase 1-like [Lethenteron reissneri]
MGLKGKKTAKSVCRRLYTILFAFLVLGGLIFTYAISFPLVTDEYKKIAFGLYGAFLALHLIVQGFFAYLERRKMLNDARPCFFTSTVALTVSAYQEDPDYLRQCLVSVKNVYYPADKLKIIMVIDGNSEDDRYMMDMFCEIFGDEAETFVWKHNYHTWTPPESGLSAEDDLYAEIAIEDEQRLELEELIRTKRVICIMQQWGGKREVMYTCFKALAGSVDYIQVCDSDTKLETDATLELVKVLDYNKEYGAVGGDVRILNLNDSCISFMSNLRYWMAFNVERSCQSYFDCVSCISGPLGLYRNVLLQQFMESWYNQKFLGTHCTFGDDRHLTNRMLSMGYATKYTSRSICYSETPAQYLRWLNQQTRWTKSYFREWLFNAMWWHKHHLWMTYESTVAGIFPFFVTATVIKLFYTGSIWDIIWVLCAIQIIGFVKSLYACWLRGNLVMVFMSLYSVLYMTSLLPTKYFAIITMNKSSWGTSGRKKMVGNYIPLLPLSIWAAILLGGLAFAIYNETQQKHEPIDKDYLIYGSVAYILFWIIMILAYWVFIRKCCRSRTDNYNIAV